MTYFAFQNDGDVYNLNGAAEKQLAATFAHGYASMQEACAKKNAPANPIQASLLASFVTEASSPVGGGTAGVTEIITVDANCKPTGSISTLNNPATGGLSDALFAPFKNQNLWTRLAEFAIGSMILYIGAKGIVSPAGNDVARQTFKQTAKYAARRAKGLTPEGRAMSAAKTVRKVKSR